MATASDPEEEEEREHDPQDAPGAKRKSFDNHGDHSDPRKGGEKQQMPPWRPSIVARQRLLRAAGGERGPARPL